MAKKTFCRRVFIEALCSALLLFGIANLLTVEAKVESIDDLNRKVLTLYQAEKYKEAIPYAMKTVEYKEKTYGANHPQFALALQNLAALYQGLGDYEKAAPLDRRSMEILDKAAGYDPHYENSSPKIQKVQK